MAFTLDTFGPWGRSLEEYRRMFAMTDLDCRRRVLGCADGPASFNAELTAAGGSVVSCDPLYDFSADEIRQQIQRTLPDIIEQTQQNADTFVWSTEIPDVDALAARRMAAMDRFLDDYEIGRRENRYISAGLPELPFADNSFDIAVCSHFLFLYSDHLSKQFHVDAVRSLIRVADEVRIFPLLELGSVPSRHIEAVSSALRGDGCRVATQTVAYEFQRGGNQMMRVVR